MTLTLTTWNVQNFTTRDPLYDQKLIYLASTIESLHADVVALQEVLEAAALEALAARLGFHAVAAEPDRRGNRVAFLTRSASLDHGQIDQWRLPADTVVRRFDTHGEIETLPGFPRPAYRVTVEDDGTPVDIITAHFKSKLLTFKGHFSTSDETLRAHTAYFALDLRAAEAASLREVASERLTRGRKVVVLGDFNDGAHAATTEMLYGPPGSQPKGAEDASHANCAFQLRDDSDAQRLFNVTKLVSEEIRWSRIHNGQEELLDHILASDALMPRAGTLRQVPTLTILNSEVRNMIGSHPIAGDVVPDHAPVTATFV